MVEVAYRNAPRPGGRTSTGLLTGAFAAMLLLGVLSPLMTISGLPMTGEGSPLRQALFPVILLLAIYGSHAYAHPRRLLCVPWLLVVALAYCWISVAWSIAPGIALRRVLLTSVVIWSAFILISQLGYGRSVLVIRIALVLTLFANYVAVAGWPDFAIHQADEPYDLKLVGDWRGIMLHKNFAGAICALTVVAFVFDAKRLPRALQVAVIAAAAYFLYRSSSRTSFGACFGAVVVGLLYVRYNARYRLPVIGVLSFGILVATAVLTIFHDPLKGHLTDREALTGRTEIWSALNGYASDHPLLGTGFGSFWNIGGDSPIYQYGTAWVRDISAGHNGFLDLIVTIGYPGFVLVVVAAVIAPLVRLFARPAASGARGALIFAVMIFCAAHNITESSLFDRDAVGQMFLMIAIALLYAITADGRDDTGMFGRPAKSRSKTLRSHPHREYT